MVIEVILTFITESEVHLLSKPTFCVSPYPEVQKSNYSKFIIDVLCDGLASHPGCIPILPLVFPWQSTDLPQKWLG